MQPAAQNTSKKSELLIIHLYCGDTDNAFLYYEDDGISFDYQHAVFSRRLLQYFAQSNTFVMARCEGYYTSPLRKVKIVFHGFKMMNTIRINEVTHDIHPEINRFFAGLEKYDPIKDPEPAPEETVMAIEIPYSADTITFVW